MSTPANRSRSPPDYAPPPVNVIYAPTPPELTFEIDRSRRQKSRRPRSTLLGRLSAADGRGDRYVRAPAPRYPPESQRGRERGTVLLRVLVDALGRPAQIQVERSSGYSRLDAAARMAVEKALFRPHEVNGIAQPAQVLIPIEFVRRSS